MEKEKKIYVGSGKETSNKDIINFSICLSDLPQEFFNEYKGKKYINLTMKKKREADQFGKTHSISINTWKPEKKQDPEQEFEDTDDLPF